MDAREIRDYDFAQLRGRLPEMCVKVYAAFDKFGPGTTREIAIASGIELLNLRPRAHELVAEGWLECVMRKGHEGVYRALTPVERAALCGRTDAQKKSDARASEQMLLAGIATR
jgi:hypothetical protein